MHKNLTTWIQNNGGYIHPALYLKTQYINNLPYTGVFCKKNVHIDEATLLTDIPDTLLIGEDNFDIFRRIFCSIFR